jgi:hypothetical protein
VLLGNIGAANEPVVVLDTWLTNLDDTDADQPMPRRLAAAKPDEAQNRCTLRNGNVVTGGWEIYDDPGPCRDAFPVFAEPRIAAGQERRGDIIKCALAPVDPEAYDVDFTSEQQERLEQIFPDGVCDWSKQGVGQQPPDGVWQTYG